MLVRHPYDTYIEELAFRNGKMAFLTGPRQVGKTTLARQRLAAHGSELYHTWDDPTFRRQWIRDPQAIVPRTTGEPSVIVLDELHKAPRWKSNLKGLFDQRGADARLLITGSARLDLFRRGGDSLVGRYFLFRLHPLSIGELVGAPVLPDQLAAALGKKLPAHPEQLAGLLAQGGFPEPYLRGDPTFTVLWRRTRAERLVREDLRDLSRVQDVALIETLVALLPERAASLLSYRSLAEDLEVAPPTARRWIEWLEQLYLVYRLSPHARDVARSLRKQPKLYLWDWSEAPEGGARFENLVAGHLLKAVHAWTDGGLGTFELRYVRDKDQREVDFLVLRDRKPFLLVEAKASDREPARALRHFAASLRCPLVVQVVGESGVHEGFALSSKDRGWVVSADAFLGLLP